MMPAVQRRPRVSPPVIQSAPIPAPIGINTMVGAREMTPGDCFYLWNMVSGEFGLRARTGYREWVTGITSADVNAIRTMAPFTGSQASSSKLFSVTSSGIWGATDSTAAPSISQSFTTTNGKAGFGVATAHVVAGGHYFFYADEANGLFRYSEASGAWEQPSDITGITEGISSVAYVKVWKNRLMMVPRNSTKVYYLAAGAIAGACNSLNFAQRFQAGGYLVGLWSLTYDGGSGMDDSLVGISSGGDVVIYQGTDPDNSDLFGLKGVWQIGAVPVGRRIAYELGGDLLVLSTNGLLPASKLVVGQAVSTAQYATAKIANRFQQLMAAHKGKWGWGLYTHPGDNALLVTVPSSGEDANSEQLAMSLTTGGWSRYRDLPVTCGCVWDGEFYFGTSDAGSTDARVCRGFDYVDAVTLAAPTSSTAVGYSLLTRFHGFGRHTEKQVQMMRLNAMNQQTQPAVSMVARYDYDISEPAAPSGTGTGGGSGSWDEGTWDSSTWGEDYTPARVRQGATGMGREIAVAIRGKAAALTSLIGVDVDYTEGGLL